MIEIPKPLYAPDSPGAENFERFLPPCQIRMPDEWTHAAGKVRRDRLPGNRITRRVIRPAEVVEKFDHGQMLDLFESMHRYESICSIFSNGEKMLTTYRRYRELFLRLRREKKTTVSVKEIAEALGDMPEAVYKHLRFHAWMLDAFEITVPEIGSRMKVRTRKENNV